MRILISKTIFTSLLLLLFCAPAFAINIREITSPLGIKAWLVEDKTLPLIALSFSFANGTATEPQGKEGVTSLMTALILEGAGDLEAKAFKEKLSELGVKIGFSASDDHIQGSFQTLSKNREAASELLKLVLTVPRFDADAIESMRKQVIVSILDRNEDPDTVARDTWNALAFPDHPYKARSMGSEQSVKALTAGDIVQANKRLLSRTNLKIVAVGDINSEDLSKLLDKTFGTLPENPVINLPEAIIPQGPKLLITERDNPQSAIVFGSQAVKRNDPDFIPAFVMGQILGSSGLGSRLMEEVREKRGLTYGIYAGFSYREKSGYLTGGFSTRNEKVGEALKIVRDVMRDVVEKGVTAKELADIKAYLTGSYVLSFSGNSDIADQLLRIYQDGLGLDYVDKRNGLIEAVSLDQIKSVAKRLLHPDQLLVSIAGKPENVKEEGISEQDRKAD